MTIGDKIKQRRLELGMTADDLAKAIGKNRATVYRYENNEIETMRSSVLIPIARALHTTPADLLSLPETKKEPTAVDSKRKKLIALIEQMTPEQQQMMIDLIEQILRKQ